MTTKTKPAIIFDAIENLVYEFIEAGHTRQSINEGACEDFAGIIADNGFGTAIWGSDIPFTCWQPHVTKSMWVTWYEHYVASRHCFIWYDGRYYDSEVSEGVDYLWQLPCFVRLEDYWVPNDDRSHQ